MRSKRPAGDDHRSKRRLLNSEDEALWRHTAQSIEPLRGANSRVPSQADTDKASGLPTAQSKHAETRPTSSSAARSAGQVAATPSHPAASRNLVHRAPPPLAEFERRKVRRIAAGTIDIEARLDLHGARQSEAHHRLKGFILDSVAAGRSTVLVITGKGGKRERPSDGRFDELDTRDHGVLRRSVPMWLAEPELRTHVVSFTTAHARHGGEGALYVHLRRRQTRSHW